MPGKTLSAREQRTLSAAAEAILPEGGPFNLGHRDVDSVGFAHELMEHVPFEVRALLHVILFFLEYLAWAFAGGPGRFSRMSVDRRNRVLDGMRSSRVFAFRGFFILLSTVLLVPFYNSPQVMDAIGYHGYRPDANKISGESI